MSLETLVRSAHVFNDQLSIVTTLAAPHEEAPFLLANCQVTTRKGEYVNWCIRRIGHEQDEQDVLDAVLAGAIEGALRLAGVEDLTQEELLQLAQAKYAGATIEPFYLGPGPAVDQGIIVEGRAEAHIGAEAKTEEQWAQIDLDPDAAGYPVCEGEGPTHAIRDYWRGTAFIPADEVARLTFGRFGKYLCDRCTAAHIPLPSKRRRAREQGE